MSIEGKLIALEGIDDTMLDRQSERLYRWLRGQGIAAERTQEPTHGPVGAQIHLYLQGRLRLDPASLALFWTADRMDHLGHENGILAQLAKGHHVLCARYLLFSYAHQLHQVDLDWLRQVNALCHVPDLTLFIDIPVPRDRASELGQLRRNYLRVIERLRAEGERIERIDGQDSADGIHRACQYPVAALLVA
jgi:dTMP kinase